MKKPSFLNRKVLVGGAIIVALLAFGWYLSSLDGRIAIVTSDAATATNTALPVTATITPVVPTLTAAADTPSALNPQAEQARAFAEPILQAIANKPPDFKDDFSANTGWQVNDYDGSGLDQIAVENGQLRLFMGGPRDLTHVSHPAVLANDFVLVVDASLEAPGWVDAPGIGWRNTTQGAHSFVVWTDHIWETRYCDNKGCEPNYIVGDPGKIVIGEPVQMMVVAKGTAFALYLNGKPLAYVDDPNRPPGADITLFAHSNATKRSAVVAFDNLKFWNLDNVSDLQAPETQARAFAETILQAIANRPPDYEYDFNETENGWISGVEESNTRGYVDGEYFVTVKPRGGTGAGPGSNFVFSDFVAELDARILKATDPGGWGFIFREQPFPQSFRYHINFNSKGMSLTLDTGSYTDLFYLQGAPVQPAPETNHLLVIAKGPNIAIYVNGEPVTVVSDSTLSSGIVSLGIHAGEQETEVRFDNFKIWNISDLP